jgi:iron complex outermembrane receptor protein
MNTYTGRHFGKVIWSEFAGNSELDHEWYRSKATKNDLNFYAKANYELIQGINVFADLQVRNLKYKIEGIDDDSRMIDQNHIFTFFNPKAGAFFTMNSSNSAYISFAMANREPNRDNFVDADPLKPLPVQETLYDMEMGHSYAKRRLSISSNLFLMYYKDQLALTGAINDVGAPVMENVPESYRMGLEVRSEFQVAKSLLWSFHATLSRNKIKSYVEYIDDWDSFTQIPVNHSNTDLSFSPSITTGNEFRWSFNKSGNISLITRYVGKQYIDNTQDENRILPSYLVNDFRFSFSFHPAFVKAIECSLHINNFLNEKYESNAWVYRYYADSSFQKMDGYFPQAGINFIAGLTLKF